MVSGFTFVESNPAKAGFTGLGFRLRLQYIARNKVLTYWGLAAQEEDQRVETQCVAWAMLQTDFLPCFECILFQTSSGDNMDPKIMFIQKRPLILETPQQDVARRLWFWDMSPRQALIGHTIRKSRIIILTICHYYDYGYKTDNSTLDLNKPILSNAQGLKLSGGFRAFGLR